ncbi:energy-coupling factor transporter transmembrane component T [Petroclostridium sp. X23]|uniref:energy-coupling factor transporter transmembrane component T family protein n=1 Tax=Petroclostridium sp. X23 TaxID=3045146 RepID=UPI0024AE8710|nr:energy-coupling factor transporter transmembrane component T [Petroclostridium sp. X23]WHH61731.1 energy-coupling factor transporter transmembrane component T [Petroclostridium sp. X23]
MVYDTPGRLLLLLAATILLLMIFRINLGVVWSYLKPFLYMMLVLFIIQCVFVREGRVLLAAGQVPLMTEKGMLTGAGVVLRIVVLVAAALLLSTFSSRDFILGLVQWKVPYELAFMVSGAIRFLPLFRDEMVNVVTAVQLRGVELKKVALRKRIEMCRCLLFPVVYGTMLKAQQMAVAMETRGFRIYPRRTCMRRLKFCFADYAVMFLSAAATLTLMVMKFNGIGEWMNG